MTDDRAQAAPGSLIIWLASAVFAVAAGLLLAYHLVLASHSVPSPVIDAAHASAQPAMPVQDAYIAPAHSEALKAATQAAD